MALVPHTRRVMLLILGLQVPSSAKPRTTTPMRELGKFTLGMEPTLHPIPIPANQKRVETKQWVVQEGDSASIICRLYVPTSLSSRVVLHPIHKICDGALR